MKPSVRTIAETTGYSTATVSRALTNSASVRPEVRRKILGAAREVGYCAGTSRILIIGEELVPSLYHDGILPHLASALRQAGYSVEFIAKPDLSLVHDHNVAGAISLAHPDGMEKYWEKSHCIPLVCINSSPSHLGSIYSVLNDDRGGTRAMVEKLISLGHRKIGIYGGSLSQNQRHQYFLERLNAFQQVLQEHHLRAEFVAPNWGEYDSTAMIKSLLDRGVTALVGNGESAAMEIYYALRVLQREIPQEISVMSWIPENLKHFFYPPLSGVVQDFPGLASCAVRLLTAQIAGKGNLADMTVPYVYVDGSSVAELPAPEGEGE